MLKVVKRLLDTGVSLQQIRTAVSHLRERGVDDLAQITLMSDGASVYECTSADEVIDLVQGGQGVFGIAVGRVWREVEGTLAALPTERADEDDELVIRAVRARRARPASSGPHRRLTTHSRAAARSGGRSRRRVSGAARAAPGRAARRTCAPSSAAAAPGPRVHGLRGALGLLERGALRDRAG